MLDKEKDVQGVALYAEWRRTGATMMVLITPDGYDTKGNAVAGAIYRRVLTPYTPKKQWRRSSLTWTPVEEASGLHDDNKALFTERRLSFATQMFDGLLSGGWTMVGKPIFVEVSKADLDNISSYKTPTKVIYRVNQSRTALGYPTEII